MNIFFLDDNPQLAANYHFDIHVFKMIVESWQLISTEVFVRGDKLSPMFKNIEFYKPTHINHPCRIWLNESDSNLKWLCQLGIHLCIETSIRYGEEANSTKLANCLIKNFVFIDRNYCKFNQEMTKPKLAMPDFLKVDSCVESYRRYYAYKVLKCEMENKRPMFNFKRRKENPSWFNSTLLEEVKKLL